jgi:hypothetical protein
MSQEHILLKHRQGALFARHAFSFVRDEIHRRFPPDLERLFRRRSSVQRRGRLTEGFFRYRKALISCWQALC